MRICPNCAATSNRFQYSAWVLQVTGTMEEDSDGFVSQIGPMRASVTIKEGKELTSKGCQLVCPKCSYRDYIQLFKVIRPCVITGQSGDVEINTPAGTVFVNNSVVDTARAMFSDMNLDWATTYGADREIF